MKLENAAGERIETDHTPRGVSATLAARTPYDGDEPLIRGIETHHSHYGGEADGLASTVLTAFDFNSWAEVVNNVKYKPENIPDTVLKTLLTIAERNCCEHEHPLALFGRMLACVGERFARHSAEYALQEHFEDTELAGVEMEFENIDVTCASGNAQVYTGSSKKYWYNKSKAPACSDGAPDNYEKAVKKTNFDVFVFIRIIDGAFYVGSKTIENKNETSAPTQAKP